MYYECMFRAKYGAYAMNYYDLKTNDEDEIIEILEADGWEVLEVYNIKETIK